MDKASSFYSGETVFCATKQGKEELGMGSLQVDIDTDQFGTFSGEVERKGSVLDTLRSKITAAATSTPHGRLFLASEGSFGPDPFVPFIQSDLESLLLWDRELNFEIYAEYLCRSPQHAEMIFDPEKEPNRLEPFLQQIDLPNHAVIVRAEGLFNPVFKGLHQRDEITRAISACIRHTKHSKVILATDL